MPSPEVYMSKDELVEELELQRVILSSIDQSVADRQEAEAIVKTEISRLEQRLHDIRQKEREAREIAAKTSISRSFQSSHSNPSGRLPSAQGNIATTRNPLQPLSFGGV
jgi:phage shock protein A